MSIDEINVQLRGNVLWVILNRPKKYNAITGDMFRELRRIFLEASENDQVSFVVFTGGKCKLFSAGSDFSPAELAKMQKAEHESHAFKYFIDTLIEFPKPVIALANGPAVGIMVTSLGLMDAVIAVEHATFHCPFSELGLCPEGVSSYSFVATMGHQKAASLLLFAEKFTANEAYLAGLVTKVISADKYEEETNRIIERYSKLSAQTFAVGKRLLRPQSLIDRMTVVNKTEERDLDKLFLSDDTINRLTNKFANPSKL